MMMELLGPDLRDDTRAPSYMLGSLVPKSPVSPIGTLPMEVPSAPPTLRMPTYRPDLATRDIKLSNMDIPGVQPSRTFTGADIKCVVHVLGNNGVTHPVLLANAQTLSYSVHREKSPVRALGHSYAVGWTRGSRTIAGSIVFTLFDREVLWDLIQSYAVDVDWAGEGEYESSVHTPMLDQLPPFDITITFANEHGDIANLAIYGVEIVDEGTVLSIDDLLVEKTCSWVARDIDMIRPYNNTSSFRAHNMDKSVTSEDINTFLSTLGNRRAAINRGVDSIHRYDIPYDYALFADTAAHNAKYTPLGYNTPVVYTADNELRWLGVATLVQEPNTVEFKPDSVYPEWTVDSKWIVHTSNLADGVEVSPGGHEMIKLYNGLLICDWNRIEVR